MVCLSWWVFLAALAAAAGAGGVAYFLWQWGLLSRPEAKG
jgi:hypothetical protein